jgi:glycosyltransferase involved in cell wall biosynthesis
MHFDAQVPDVAPQRAATRCGIEAERPRVLFIVNVAWFFLSHRLPVARAARAAGYEVHLLAAVTSPAEVTALERDGIILHRAPNTRGSVNPLADLRFLLRTLRVMRTVVPVLVHNVTVKPVLYGTLAARMLHIPGIINAISGLGYAFSDQSRWMLATTLRGAYRFALRSSRVHVVFQNDDDAREFLSAGIVSRDQSVLIRGSGVDLLTYHPAPEDPATPPLVVLPARMLRDKGIVEFSGAARLLRERGCDARMVLAGPLDPSNPTALTREEIARVTAEAPVEWLGQVEDMPGLLRRAHIVCLPSYYREGVPKSLIEACAAGRPIVTTDLPGCRAVVTHGSNGLLVPARDVSALADALQALIGNPGLRASFGAAGRARAEREFGVERIVEETLSLYGRALCAS